MAVIKKTLFIAAATFTAQLIAVSFQPILKDLYSVEDFGVFQLYLTLVNFAAVIFTFKIEYFLYQIRSERLFYILTGGIFLLTFIIFLVVFPFAYIFLSNFSFDNKYSTLSFGFLILCGGLFSAIYRFSLVKSSLTQNYNSIGKARIFRRLNEGVMQTILHKLGTFGLGLGEIFGNLIFTLISNKFYKKGFFDYFNFSFDKYFKYTQYFISRNKNLAFRKSITDIIDIWSESVLIIALSIYATFEILGFFELASRLLVGPMALVAASVSPIIIGTARKNLNNAKYSLREYFFIALFLFLSAVVLFVIHINFTEKLIEYFFGEEWLPVVSIIDILLFYILFQFIVAPFGETLVINNRLKWDANWKVARAVGLSLILLPINIEIHDRLVLFCIINIIFYLIYACLIIRCIFEGRQNDS